MPARKASEGSTSIGELYGKIQVSGEEFATGPERLFREPDPFFVRLCKGLYKLSPSLGRRGFFTEENKSAVEFLKWNLSAQEFSAASKLVLMLSVLAALLLGTIIVLTPLSEVLVLLSGGGFAVYFYAYAPFLLIAFLVTNFFTNFPVSVARREQTKALTYVPELLGYMVMSIKLVPNLEKAVEFASKHGRGKIAKDFRELVWSVQVGAYNSLSEGLDALAYRWGKYSSEFKRALMRIRASVIENTEAKRFALLDETITEILESIRNKMEQYARDLQQPSTMLFYIGVLLPLLLIIILPVGSSFSGAPLANPIVLFLIYNIIIPLVTIVFAYNLLQTRPPTYSPPVIPDDYPSLPPKYKARLGGINIDVRFAAIFVLLLGLGISFTVSAQGLPPKFVYGAIGLPEDGEQLLGPDLSKEDALSRAGRPTTYYALDDSGERFREIFSQQSRFASDAAGRETIVEAVRQQVRSEEQLFFSQSDNDVAPYKLVFGSLISIALAAFIFLYYSSIYKRRVQFEVQQLETEFKDSLYVLASRMGENKPVEDAMKHVTEFLPNAKVSAMVFGRTLDNIKLLGMPLEQAVFDKNAGSVAKIPSELIRGSMRMLVDSVRLGVNVAARTLISLSIQLQNAEKVNSTLRVLVSDVTGTMKTMTLFIAPIVLGITTSLQRIVIVTISSIAASDILASSDALSSGLAPSSFSGLSVSGFISAEAIANIASPTQFIFIVAIYIIELVLIMTYFTTKIEEDNDLLVRLNIATFLPIAVVIFVVSMVVSNFLIGAV